MAAAGAVATSFEVGRIPQFVNFRAFKVGSQIVLRVRARGAHGGVAGRRHHVACIGEHHGHHHYDNPCVVFVSARPPARSC